MSTIGTDHAIVLPGSGYKALADHEAEPIAEWIRGTGLTASVFQYPVLTRHPAPLQAIHREVARVRAEGAQRVALVGFSAGGHVAAHAALAPGERSHGGVDLVIVGYSVASMLSDAHEGSRTNLLGPDADEDLRSQTSAELLVSFNAPPFFIWHTAEDTAVNPSHSLRLAHALSSHGVPFELHIYEQGHHGVGLAHEVPTARHWTSACEAWLRSRGRI